MLRELHAEDYVDKVYGRGLHVVLLYTEDEAGLWRQAMRSLEPLVDRFRTSSRVNIWVCKIEDAADAEAVQVAKLPQFRIFANGSETHTEIGVMDGESVLNRVFAAEEG